MNATNEMSATKPHRVQCVLSLDQDVANALYAEMKMRNRQGIEGRAGMISGIVEELVRKHLLNQ